MPISANRPLRCVHYLDAVLEEAGGVVRAVLDLTAALADRDVDVVLLTGDATDAPEPWLAGEPGVPRVEVIDNRHRPWRPAPEPVLSAISAADVVHLHTPWAPFNLAVAGAARRAGTPYVVSIHGMLDDWCVAHKKLKKQIYLAAGGRRMLEGAARLHFTAEGERDQSMKWAPAARAAVLPLVMDLSPFEQLPGPATARAAFPPLAAGGPKLLFLSRVHPKKGVERLIEATAKLQQAGHKPTTLVAGPGDAAYIAGLERLAEQLGVADAVHFLGMVRGETKLSLYQACDLFVLPTSQENFGIVLTEAMACGLPVVTTRGVDIWQELQRHGARVVDADAAVLADAVDGLLHEGEALAERGRQGREGVFAWLDPATVTRQYAGLYRECLA